MGDEGYHIALNRVEPIFLDTDVDSSSPQSIVIANATPATGTVGLPSPTLISRISSSMLNPMPSSFSASNAMPLLSPDVFSRYHLLSPGNIFSNHPAADMAMLRTAEGQGRTLFSGVPSHRITSGMTMDTLNLPCMASNLNNQRQMHLQLPEQLHMLQQLEEMKSLLQPPAVASSAGNVGVPFTMQEYDLQPQMSPQQLSPSLELIWKFVTELGTLDTLI